MKHWIWSVGKDDWETIKAKEKWVKGIPIGDSIVKGDKIIFNVTKPSWVQGIFKVTSDWHPTSSDWPRDVSGGVKANLEIDLELVQLGFARIEKLKDDLEFVEDKNDVSKYLRGYKFGHANLGRPVSKHDADIIYKKLKEVQERPSKH